MAKQRRKQPLSMACIPTWSPTKLTRDDKPIADDDLKVQGENILPALEAFNAIEDGLENLLVSVRFKDSDRHWQIGVIVVHLTDRGEIFVPGAKMKLTLSPSSKEEFREKMG